MVFKITVPLNAIFMIAFFVFVKTKLVNDQKNYYCACSYIIYRIISLGNITTT